MSKFRHALERSRSGESLTADEVFGLLDKDDLQVATERLQRLRMVQRLRRLSRRG